MRRIRTTYGTYRPHGTGHCHIYVVTPGHPSLTTGQQDTVQCSICYNDIPATTAHLHQGEHICPDCWDDRPKASE
jgi:hypothetical protein